MPDMLKTSRMTRTAALFASGWLAAAGLARADPPGSDSLYRTKCTACHKLYPARKYTYQKLELYAARYGKGLNPEERSRLLDYFKENAKQEGGEDIGRLKRKG